MFRKAMFLKENGAKAILTITHDVLLGFCKMSMQRLMQTQIWSASVNKK